MEEERQQLSAKLEQQKTALENEKAKLYQHSWVHQWANGGKV